MNNPLKITQSHGELVTCSVASIFPPLLEPRESATQHQIGLAVLATVIGAATPLIIAHALVAQTTG